jgi:hypothetical protein
MPSAIIAPSVLASDFGQLTAECKRMIKGGAQWLHMGAFNSRGYTPSRWLCSVLSFMKTLWMGNTS